MKNYALSYFQTETETELSRAYSVSVEIEKSLLEWKIDKIKSQQNVPIKQR